MTPDEPITLIVDRSGYEFDDFATGIHEAAEEVAVIGDLVGELSRVLTESGNLLDFEVHRLPIETRVPLQEGLRLAEGLTGRLKGLATELACLKRATISQAAYKRYAKEDL